MTTSEENIKIKQGEVPKHISDFINIAVKGNYTQLVKHLSIGAWNFGKYELSVWSELLDLFNKIYKQAASPIANFTVALLENSFSRTAFDCLDPILALLKSKENYVVDRCLSILYTLGKRSTYLSRLENDIIVQFMKVLSVISNPWKFEDKIVSLKEACDSNFVVGPNHFIIRNEFELKNLFHKTPSKFYNVSNIAQNFNVYQSTNVQSYIGNLVNIDTESSTKVFRFFYRIKLAACSHIYSERITMIRNKLLALSIVANIVVLNPKYTMNGMDEHMVGELVDFLKTVYKADSEKSDVYHIDNSVDLASIDSNVKIAEIFNCLAIIRAQVLTALASLIYINTENLQNSVMNMLEIPYYHGFIHKLTRAVVWDFINNKVPVLNPHLSIAVFSYIYHMSNCKLGGVMLIKCEMIKIILPIVHYECNKTEIAKTMFITRAMRIIDLITNYDEYTDVEETFKVGVIFIHQLHLYINMDIDTISHYRKTRTKSGKGKVFKDVHFSCDFRISALIKTILTFMKKVVKVIRFEDAVVKFFNNTEFIDSLVKLIQNCDYYGHSVYTVVIEYINLHIACYPSNLQVLQDVGLMECVVNSFFDGNFHPNVDLAMVSSVLSSMCLNTRGLEYCMSKNIMRHLMEFIYMPLYTNLMKRKKHWRIDDGVNMSGWLGYFIDDFARKHNSLPHILSVELLRLLDTLIDIGNDESTLYNVEMGKRYEMPKMTKFNTTDVPSNACIPQNIVNYLKMSCNDYRDSTDDLSEKSGVFFTHCLNHCFNFLRVVLVKCSNAEINVSNLFKHNPESQKKLLSVLNSPNIPIEFNNLPFMQDLIKICASFKLHSEQNDTIEWLIKDLNSTLDESREFLTYPDFADKKHKMKKTDSDKRYKEANEDSWKSLVVKSFLHFSKNVTYGNVYYQDDCNACYGHDAMRIRRQSIEIAEKKECNHYEVKCPTRQTAYMTFFEGESTSCTNRYNKDSDDTCKLSQIVFVGHRMLNPVYKDDCCKYSIIDNPNIHTCKFQDDYYNRAYVDEKAFHGDFNEYIKSFNDMSGTKRTRKSFRNSYCLSKLDECCMKGLQYPLRTGHVTLFKCALKFSVYYYILFSMVRPHEMRESHLLLLVVKQLTSIIGTNAIKKLTLFMSRCSKEYSCFMDAFKLVSAYEPYQTNLDLKVVNYKATSVNVKEVKYFLNGQDFSMDCMVSTIEYKELCRKVEALTKHDSQFWVHLGGFIISLCNAVGDVTAFTSCLVQNAANVCNISTCPKKSTKFNIYRSSLLCNVFNAAALVRQRSPDDIVENDYIFIDMAMMTSYWSTVCFDEKLYPFCLLLESFMLTGAFDVFCRQLVRAVNSGIKYVANYKNVRVGVEMKRNVVPAHYLLYLETCFSLLEFMTNVDDIINSPFQVNDISISKVTKSTASCDSSFNWYFYLKYVADFVRPMLENILNSKLPSCSKKLMSSCLSILGNLIMLDKGTNQSPLQNIKPLNIISNIPEICLEYIKKNQEKPRPDFLQESHSKEVSIVAYHIIDKILNFTQSDDEKSKTAIDQDSISTCIYKNRYENAMNYNSQQMVEILANAFTVNRCDYQKNLQKFNKPHAIKSIGDFANIEKFASKFCVDFFKSPQHEQAIITMGKVFVRLKGMGENFSWIYQIFYDCGKELLHCAISITKSLDNIASKFPVDNRNIFSKISTNIKTTFSNLLHFFAFVSKHATINFMQQNKECHLYKAFNIIQRLLFMLSNITLAHIVTKPQPWICNAILFVDSLCRNEQSVRRNAINDKLVSTVGGRWCKYSSTNGWVQFDKDTDKLLTLTYKKGKMCDTIRLVHMILRINFLNMTVTQLLGRSPLVYKINYYFYNDPTIDGAIHKTKDGPMLCRRYKPVYDYEKDLNEILQVDAVKSNQDYIGMLLNNTNNSTITMVHAMLNFILGLNADTTTIHACLLLISRLSRCTSLTKEFYEMGLYKIILHIPKKFKFCGFIELVTIILANAMEDDNVISSAIYQKLHLHAFWCTARPQPDEDDFNNCMRSLNAAALHSPKQFVDIAVKMMSLQSSNKNLCVEAMNLPCENTKNTPSVKYINYDMKDIGQLGPTALNVIYDLVRCSYTRISYFIDYSVRYMTMARDYISNNMYKNRNHIIFREGLATTLREESAFSHSEVLKLLTNFSRTYTNFVYAVIGQTLYFDNDSVLRDINFLRFIFEFLIVRDRPDDSVVDAGVHLLITIGSSLWKGVDNDCKVAKFFLCQMSIILSSHLSMLNSTFKVVQINSILSILHAILKSYLKEVTELDTLQATNASAAGDLRLKTNPEIYFILKYICNQVAKIPLYATTKLKNFNSLQKSSSATVKSILAYMLSFDESNIPKDFRGENSKTYISHWLKHYSDMKCVLIEGITREWIFKVIHPPMPCGSRIGNCSMYYSFLFPHNVNIGVTNENLRLYALFNDFMKRSLYPHRHVRLQGYEDDEKLLLSGTYVANEGFKMVSKMDHADMTALKINCERELRKSDDTLIVNERWENEEVPEDEYNETSVSNDDFDNSHDESALVIENNNRIDSHGSDGDQSQSDEESNNRMECVHSDTSSDMSQDDQHDDQDDDDDDEDLTNDEMELDVYFDPDVNSDYFNDETDYEETSDDNSLEVEMDNEIDSEIHDTTANITHEAQSLTNCIPLSSIVRGWLPPEYSVFNEAVPSSSSVSCGMFSDFYIKGYDPNVITASGICSNKNSNILSNRIMTHPNMVTCEIPYGNCIYSDNRKKKRMYNFTEMMDMFSRIPVAILGRGRINVEMVLNRIKEGCKLDYIMNRAAMNKDESIFINSLISNTPISIPSSSQANIYNINILSSMFTRWTEEWLLLDSSLVFEVLPYIAYILKNQLLSQSLLKNSRMIRNQNVVAHLNEFKQLVHRNETEGQATVEFECSEYHSDETDLDVKFTLKNDIERLNSEIKAAVVDVTYHKLVNDVNKDVEVVTQCRIIPQVFQRFPRPGTFLFRRREVGMFAGLTPLEVRRIGMNFPGMQHTDVTDDLAQEESESERDAVQNETEPVAEEELQVEQAPDNIDPAFLDALPENMRNEVIRNQSFMLAQHHEAQHNVGRANIPRTIDSDFLAALPENLQTELLTNNFQVVLPETIDVNPPRQAETRLNYIDIDPPTRSNRERYIEQLEKNPKTLKSKVMGWLPLYNEEHMLSLISDKSLINETLKRYLKTTWEATGRIQNIGGDLLSARTTANFIQYLCSVAEYSVLSQHESRLKLNIRGDYEIIHGSSSSKFPKIDEQRTFMTPHLNHFSLCSFLIMMLDQTKPLASEFKGIIMHICAFNKLRFWLFRSFINMLYKSIQCLAMKPTANHIEEDFKGLKINKETPSVALPDGLEMQIYLDFNIPYNIMTTSKMVHMSARRQIHHSQAIKMIGTVMMLIQECIDTYIYEFLPFFPFRENEQDMNFFNNAIKSCNIIKQLSTSEFTKNCCDFWYCWFHLEDISYAKGIDNDMELTEECRINHMYSSYEYSGSFVQCFITLLGIEQIRLDPVIFKSIITVLKTLMNGYVSHIKDRLILIAYVDYFMETRRAFLNTVQNKPLFETLVDKYFDKSNVEFSSIREMKYSNVSSKVKEESVVKSVLLLKVPDFWFYSRMMRVPDTLFLLSPDYPINITYPVFDAHAINNLLKAFPKTLEMEGELNQVYKGILCSVAKISGMKNIIIDQVLNFAKPITFIITRELNILSNAVEMYLKKANIDYNANSKNRGSLTRATKRATLKSAPVNRDESIKQLLNLFKHDKPERISGNILESEIDALKVFTGVRSSQKLFYELIDIIVEISQVRYVHRKISTKYNIHDVCELKETCYKHLRMKAGGNFEDFMDIMNNVTILKPTVCEVAEDYKNMRQLSSVLNASNMWKSLGKCLNLFECLGNPAYPRILEPLVEALFLLHCDSAAKKKDLQGDTAGKKKVEMSEKILGILKPTKDYVSVSCTEEKDPVKKSDIPAHGYIDSDSDTEKFLAFAETHRSILNNILRDRCRDETLVDGPFFFIGSHTHLLDFDVKVNYFFSKLADLFEDEESPGITLNVTRKNVFEESYRQMHGKDIEEWRRRMNVQFVGEEGQDAGGLLREWYRILSREIFNPDYGLFKVCSGDRSTFTINPSSHANQHHLSYYTFVGRIIAKAICDHQLLDCYFTQSMYKHIVGLHVRFHDFEQEDEQFYSSMKYIMTSDMSTMGSDFTFTYENCEFGVTKVVDLRNDGANVVVTNENKEEYVDLYCRERMVGSIRRQLAAFLTGFYEILPEEYISIFNHNEVELLISGLPTIDLQDLRSNTVYFKYQVDSPQILWFWQVLESFDPSLLAKFLQFVTGSSRVPLHGFGHLEGMNGNSSFRIHLDPKGTSRLPVAHTCFNQLDLPLYESFEKLKTCLIKAITECSSFGLV